MEDKIKKLIEQIEKKEIHLSFSSLKSFNETPEQFINYKLSKFEATPAMIFGSLVDCLLLTPEKFEEEFYIGYVPTSENQLGFVRMYLETGDKDEAFDSNYKKRTVSSYPDALLKTLTPYIEAKREGKYIVSSDQVSHAKKLVRKLKTNRASRKLIMNTTQTQKKISFTYRGWKIVGYIDSMGEKFMWDLKVTDAKPDKVSRFIFDRKTYIQLGIYNMGLQSEGIHIMNDKESKEITGHKIVAVDVNDNISVHNITNDFIARGMLEFKLWIQNFEKCVLMKKWGESYEFYKTEYDVNTPYWAQSLMPLWDD